MHPNALIEASHGLNKVRVAVTAMASSQQDSAAVEARWGDFLSAVSAVYSKLAEGANASSRGEAWFVRKARERRTDPLLKFIRRARNAGDHGIKSIANRPGSQATIPPDGHTIEESNGDIGRQNDGVVLVRISGKGGAPLDPPETHLGQPLPDKRPLTVARLGLAYLEQMLIEARAL